MRKTIRSLVMDYVEHHGTAKRKDIIRFIKQCNGKPYTNPTDERGYYGWAFDFSFLIPTKTDGRCLINDCGRGIYRVINLNYDGPVPKPEYPFTVYH